jgi:hypothetical protein
MSVLGSRWMVAAATATVFSPKIRGMVQTGVVYGLAGVIKAGRGVYQGVRETAATAEHVARGEEHPAEAAPAAPEEAPKAAAEEAPKAAGRARAAEAG